MSKERFERNKKRILATTDDPELAAKKIADAKKLRWQAEEGERKRAMSPEMAK